MIKVYLDMDGVICNFEEKFAPLRSPGKKYDKEIFAKAVMEDKIFETLDWMPNGKRLIDVVRSLPITVEILTSVGTHRPLQAAEAARQKQKWLHQHNILYKANFVNMFSEKKNYAYKNTILIDDRPDCALPFTSAGGYGILYSDSKHSDAVKELQNIILQLKAIET